MKKLLPYAAGIALIMGLGYAYLQSEKARAEKAGYARAVVEELEPLQERYADMVVMFGHRDSIRSAQLDSVKSVHAEDTLRLREAHSQSDSMVAVLDSIISVNEGAPVDARIVQSTVGQLQSEIGACSRALRSCQQITARQDTILTDLRGQLSFADSLIVKQSEAIRRLQDIPEKSTLIPWAVAGGSLTLLILSLLR